MRWTEEEKTTMMNLAMSTNMTTQEVTDMLNEKYDNKRTTKSVESKKNRVLEDLGIINKKKDVTIVKTKMVDRNSRKGWTTAEDRVLIDKWTADKKNQEKLKQQLVEQVTKSIKLPELSSPALPTAQPPQSLSMPKF